MSALRMSVPSRTSKMRMQQVTAFADIAALSPSSTVRRAMCCRDTARAMPPLCFSKIGLLAFQHQSATGGSSPLAKAMRSCFIIKTPSATRRQALCLGYHLQRVSQNTISGYLEYISDHDLYRNMHPLYPVQSKKNSPPPMKGTKRYRKEQKRAAKKARRQSIAHVLTLIENLDTQARVARSM